MSNKKLRVAVIFGGKSPEHEVSIITGLQTIEHIDKEKFDVLPLYIAKDGRWFSGTELLNIETYRDLVPLPRKATQQTVTLDNEQKGLQSLSKNSFSLFKKSSQHEPIDIIFPAFHGGLGENGGFAGLFEVMDIPYVGPGITGGALGMDKIVMKQLFQQAEIPITKYLWFYRHEWNDDRNKMLAKVEEQLKYPLFVKPATGGSSIGTAKAKNKQELEQAIEVAAAFDRKIIVEESFENAREINISVIGNAGSGLMVSVCEEVFSTGEVLSFEDKYVGNAKSKGQTSGMAATARQIPAKISKEIEKKIQELAKEVFNLLDASGVSRIDFLIRERTEEVRVIEINTIPGSLSFYLWEASGLSFTDMNTKLINLAREKYEESHKSITTFSSNILENFNQGSKIK